MSQSIAKPIHRSAIRKLLGKEFYILKRKWQWLTSHKKWAKKTSNDPFPHSIFHHRSMILRPLKGVDMYLQENKRTNLRLAIEHLNGIIIQPGETFSLWKLVGRPSASKGYLDGLVLEQGTISKGIGGGLCQLGNLLFWIVAHSPLTITERYRHSFDVFPDINRTIPFGAGATLAYNHIDFQFTNNTNFPYHLKLWLDDIYLNGNLSTTATLKNEYTIKERNHIIKQQPWGGYSRHNQLYKVTKHNDGSIDDELLVQNDAIMMYEPLLKA